MSVVAARTKEEGLLLFVALGAAAVVVASLVPDVPPGLRTWAPVAAAASLSLVSLFAFWFAGAARRALGKCLRHERHAAQRVLAAVPEGLLVVREDRILSVNRRFCDLVGFEREELVGAAAPFAFWPPEHRHEIERWQASLSTSCEQPTELVFARRSGARIAVLVSGGRLHGEDEAAYVLSVRDTSASRERERRLEELASRDPQTGLLNERGLDESLRDSVCRALDGGESLSLAVLALGDAGEPDGLLLTPSGRVAVDRLERFVRAGEAVARLRGDLLAWILPRTDANGAVKAVARARDEVAEASGLDVTAGICELAAAGDALAMHALAERALVAARGAGTGTTACYPNAWPDDVDDLARTLVS